MDCAARSVESVIRLSEFYRYDYRRADRPEPEPTLNRVESHRFSIHSDITMVGQLITMRSRPGDTLPDIGRLFGLGFNDITEANPDLDIWVPKPGSRVSLPVQFILPDAPRKGIVLNLSDMRLFYYPQSAKTEESEVITYPIGIGRDGWSTPIGTPGSQKKHPDRFYWASELLPIGAADWTADAGTFELRSEAETLARILIHQGPIPSRVRTSPEGYQVILGPFDNRKELEKTKKRIFRQFEIAIKPIEPTI